MSNIGRILNHNPNLSFGDLDLYTRRFSQHYFNLGVINIDVVPLVNLARNDSNSIFLIKENSRDTLNMVSYHIKGFNATRLGSAYKPLMSTYYYLHGYTKLGVPKLLYVLCLKNKGLEYFKNSSDILVDRTIPLQHLVCYMDSKAFKECGHNARLKDAEQINLQIAPNLEVIDKENLIEYFLYGK